MGRVRINRKKLDQEEYVKNKVGLKRQVATAIKDHRYARL